MSIRCRSIAAQVRVGERQGRERAGTGRDDGDQLGVLVVDLPGRIDRRGLVQAVRQLREHGSTPDEASKAAGHYMEEVLHVPSSRSAHGPGRKPHSAQTYDTDTSAATPSTESDPDKLLTDSDLPRRPPVTSPPGVRIDELH